MSLRYLTAAFALAMTTISVMAEEEQPTIDTAVVSQSDAKVTEFEGAVVHSYFSGDSVGTVSALTGTAVIQPGMEIHPPHQHFEEEYLVITEGTGTWTVGDKSFSAKAGDTLYAAPWVLHGVRNTGDVPLKFVFTKWHSKGMPKPTKVE